MWQRGRAKDPDAMPRGQVLRAAYWRNLRLRARTNPANDANYGARGRENRVSPFEGVPISGGGPNGSRDTPGLVFCSWSIDRKTMAETREIDLRTWKVGGLW